MDKVSSAKSHNCSLGLMFLCLSTALCQPLSPLRHKSGSSKILNIHLIFSNGRGEEQASGTAAFVVVQRSFSILWVSQRQFRVQVCVMPSSAQVWAASEMRSRFPGPAMCSLCWCLLWQLWLWGQAGSICWLNGKLAFQTVRAIFLLDWILRHKTLEGWESAP